MRLPFYFLLIIILYSHNDMYIYKFQNQDIVISRFNFKMLNTKTTQFLTKV